MSPPDWLIAAGYVLQFVAAFTAVAAARRRRFHWPFAFYTLALAFGDVLHAAILRVLHTYPTPYCGVPRAMFSATVALTALPAVALLMAACAMLPAPATAPLPQAPSWQRVMRATRRNLVLNVAGAAALAWTLAVMAYPWLAEGRLQRAYMAMHLVCQAGCWAVVVLIVRAKHFALLPTYALLIATLAADLMLWVGPFAGNMFADWRFVLNVYLALQVSTCVTQMAWLRSIGAPAAVR